MKYLKVITVMVLAFILTGPAQAQDHHRNHHFKRHHHVRHHRNQ